MKEEIIKICTWLKKKAEKSECPGLIEEIIREIKSEEYLKINQQIEKHDALEKREPLIIDYNPLYLRITQDLENEFNKGVK